MRIFSFLALISLLPIPTHAAPTSRPATRSKAAAKKAAAKKAAPKKAAPKKAAPKKAAPKKAAPKKAAAKAAKRRAPTTRATAKKATRRLVKQTAPGKAPARRAAARAPKKAPVRQRATKAAQKAAARRAPVRRAAAPVRRAAAPVRRAAAPVRRAAAPARRGPMASFPLRKAPPRRRAKAKQKKPGLSRHYGLRVPPANDAMRRGIYLTGNMLAAVLMRHGRDPNNPWLLAHSLLALGKQLKLKNGKLAIDRIVQGYLKTRTEKGKLVYYFPPGTRRNRIEPHPYMHLKTFLEIGVPLTHRFRYGKNKTVTLKQLVTSAIKSFPATPRGKAFGPLAWRLSAIYGHTPKNVWLWTNNVGHSVNFLQVIFRAIRYANHQSNFLRILMKKKVKVIPKRKQYIYKEACGGFHLLQAVFRWMGHPTIKRHAKNALKTHKELIFYRMRGEVALYVQMFKRYKNNPAYRFVLLLQQLKFMGHALETLTNLYNWGLFVPTRKERVEIRKGVRILLITVMLIHRLGFFRGIHRLKKSTYQFYLDLLGDSAHALHAMRMIERTPLYTP